MNSFETVAEVMRYVKANYSLNNALNYQTIGGEEWIQYSSQEFVDHVKYLALGLKELGVEKGSMIGLLANSSPKWTIVDLAIMVAGGVSIPLFANISEENFDFEIQQTSLKYIFVSGKDQWQKISNHQSQFIHVIALFGESDFANFSYDDLIIRGKKIEAENSEAYQNLLNANQPKDLATIVFTSGSTGVPKGVMLSHENITSLLHIDPFNWKSGKDVYLSILPLAHIFARTLNLIMITWGIPVYYVRYLNTFGDLCRSIHPSILVVVPRILEKVYDVMCAKVESSEILKRAIGHWAFDLANNEEDSLYKRMVHPIADKIVYSALRDALGGNLRIVISGGAPLNPHLYHFFRDIGVPLFEGWGLTEAAAVSCNRIGNVKIGTVGLPFDGIQVRVSSENELLIKGALVMQGYYKNEEATNNAFTADGWLKTGDRGNIDENGFITIEGRLKELYKTSTGEYIAPLPIEQELCKAPLIDMAMVVVEKRKFASCLLFPNLEILKKLKIAANQGHLSDEEFVNSDFIKNQMDHLLNELNSHLNHWEQIHGYKFILTPPTIEGGELTPTMKLKRQAVIQKYNKLIDKIYTGEETMTERIAVIDGIRTPFAKANGFFKKISADNLAAITVRELISRTGIDPNRIDEVIYGNVLQPPNATNIARVLSVKGGVPEHIPAMTVNRNCASGLEAIIIACNKINLNEGDIYLVGGCESMSHFPVMFNNSMREWLLRFSKAKGLKDKLKAIGAFRPRFLAPDMPKIADPLCGLTMGQTAEVLSRQFKIAREEQEAFALRSQQRAAHARATGRFSQEIIPIALPPKYGVFMEQDDGPRDNQTLEGLVKLPPAFDKLTGTVTAGTSSQVTDGAVSLLVMRESKAIELGYQPIGYLTNHAVAALAPERMGLGPAYAIAKLLKQTNTKLSDYDLIEINEAFAAQVLAVIKALGSDEFAQKELNQDHAVGIIDESLLNVNGGAIALGHPLGASGARLVLTLLKELKQRNKHKGIASLCVGGGQGQAISVEVA